MADFDHTKLKSIRANIIGVRTIQVTVLETTEKLALTCEVGDRSYLVYQTIIERANMSIEKADSALADLRILETESGIVKDRLTLVPDPDLPKAS